MFHIKDEEFIRGDAPMTKEEIRTVSISKLNLKENSILVDVGAGTGSVGIEASRYLKYGAVTGIECSIKGIESIVKNLKKFDVSNYTLIKGMAPKDLGELTFDRMFIGGSKGNMEEIFKYFMKYSLENSMIVINAIALETLSESLNLLKKYSFEKIEVVSLSVSKNRSVGRLNMMMGENPIYILSAKKGKENV